MAAQLRQPSVGRAMAAQPCQPSVGQSNGGTALSALSGAEQWRHSPVSPQWGRAMAAQPCQPSVGRAMAAQPCQPSVGQSNGGTALSALSGAEQWRHSPVSPQWGRAMAAQPCQPSVGQRRAESPWQWGRAWLWQVPLSSRAGRSAPTLMKSPEKSSMGRWETQRHGRPITAPTLGPGPVAPQPAWAALPIPAHPEVGTRWGVHLPPHPPLFLPQWPVAGWSPTGGTLTTSSAATLPTRTPAEYMRASITWRAELQSFTPVTSLCGRALTWEQSCLWFWATLSCHLLACKKPNEKLTDEPEAVRKGCEEEAEEDVLDLAKSSEEETGSRAPAQGEFPYRALQEYPTNNMVTGYTSARDMKKYVGELCDFIPGTSGYAVYWIQNEVNIYSDVKTKTKRKYK
ncbi:telomere repeats-binding bouquet formation protein 2 isoform X3 [Accipiter gentilis]|uniref:telomere repeats-binding bouquet formation protein 2 isoform X3 n=1 Tax=Astur gentilis TaxID=8957 RepID=UPI00211030F9|nr:telomere repeats-binding bouquet formation protein 2 isoform X3 [Accipiter gentilis]